MSSAMSVSHQPDVGRFCRNMTSSEKSIASSCLDQCVSKDAHT